MDMIAHRPNVCEWVNACEAHRAVAEQTPKSMRAVNVKYKDRRPDDKRSQRFQHPRPQRLQIELSM